jgi:hypothetical protein
VLQQDAVLHGLVPSLDLALGLWVVGCATNMLHALFFDIIRQIACDVRRAVIAEQSWLVRQRSRCRSRMPQRQSSVSVTSSAFIVVQSFQAMM